MSTNKQFRNVLSFSRGIFLWTILTVVMKHPLIDQPSIPYYADKTILDNDDKKQLTKAFCLLNDFMKEIIVDEEGHFQIILIEHADESYWDKLEFFYTVAKFSKSGNGGLVPKSIYEK